ncbi:TonB family protein [Acinetobacter pollinis]|uniref:TonB family protein n=1 Tax=Acinetobacter pollinis TaxID=2605270 RepID=A0ABU6DSP9_9GAMM|nr:TonB family protein [Acinetobacter pollinis]MEB5476874.1 TonB family protein [Acinetobacter pollinis]
MSTYFVYQNRHILSWCPAVFMGAYLLFMSQPDALKIQPKYDEKTIEISLAEPLPEPTPKVIEPQTQPEPIPTPTPEPDVPVEDAMEQVKPKPKVKVEQPKPKPEPLKPKIEPKVKKVEPKIEAKVEKEVEKPTPEVTQKTDTPRVEAPKADVVEKPKAEPVVEKPKPTPPVVHSAGNPSAEAGYLKQVRAAVEEQKRYPTGREASLDRPEGNVVVWLQVDRSGKVLDSGISEKSKSMLLNRAALSSLQNIKQVEPFPAEAFAGESQKKFIATLNYSAP